MRRPYASGRPHHEHMDTRVVCQRVLAAAHPPVEEPQVRADGVPRRHARGGAEVPVAIDARPVEVIPRPDDEAVLGGERGGKYLLRLLEGPDRLADEEVEPAGDVEGRSAHLVQPVAHRPRLPRRIAGRVRGPVVPPAVGVRARGLAAAIGTSLTLVEEARGPVAQGAVLRHAPVPWNAP